jgi:hypothetical protein
MTLLWLTGHFWVEQPFSAAFKVSFRIRLQPLRWRSSLFAQGPQVSSFMSLINRPQTLGLILLLSSLAHPDCLSFDQAKKHVGEIKCITGKVVRVKQGSGGVHFLDFCDDFRLCPFTVVIFPSDLKSVGDVRQLAGRMIEIHGQVKEYDGRAEIILEEYRQLSGSGAKIPPLPKNYDVEQKGRYSAGTFSHAKPGKKAAKKKQPAKLPTEIPEDSE